MSDTLPVHVNRSSLHSLEVPERFETDGSFDVRLVNHGEPIHVHLHLDDRLSQYAAIEAPNHHVDRESDRSIRVQVHRPGSVLGKLKVVTSYGAETRYVDVELEEPTESDDGVEVDESLSKPQPDAGEQSSGETAGEGTPLSVSSDRDLPVAVLALGAVAVALAIGVAAVIGGTIPWLVALLVFTVAAAAVLLVAQ